MKGFEATGRMTVEKFERLFQAEFGVYCDLIDQKGNFADESATLASLRPDEFEGPKKVDFSLRANMQVGNVIKKVKENFGIDIIIYDLAEPEEKSTLASVSKFTYLKQQKKIAHISDELEKIVAELEDEDDDEKDNNLLKMSYYYNLRFGYCNSESEGDFIDNIEGKFNIYVVNGEADEGAEYLCLYFKNEFKIIEDSSITDNLDLFVDHMSAFCSANIAKGLIQSGYENSDDGIIDNAPDYEEHYFDTREDDSVDGYTPCFFVVSSVTYDCNCQIDKTTGSVHFNNEVIENMSEFFGYLDEDESYVIGVIDDKNN